MLSPGSTFLSGRAVSGVSQERSGSEAMPVGSQRFLFDVPEGVAYFNTANMSPLLRRVREAGERGLARRARPWEVAADDWFNDVERLRAGFADVLGSDSDGVALVPASSYGLAVAARNIEAGPGDQVVVLAGSFPRTTTPGGGFASPAAPRWLSFGGRQVRVRPRRCSGRWASTHGWSPSQTFIGQTGLCWIWMR